MRKRLFLFVALVTLLGFYGCSEKTSVVEEQEVAVGGGTFTVGDVKFEIPDGALDKEIKLTAKEIANPKDLPSLKRPSEMVAAFEFGPDGTEFKKPVKVTVTLPKAMKSGKYLVSTYFPDEDTWEGVLFADVNGTVATFEVEHFSHYAVQNITEGEIQRIMSTIERGVMNSTDPMQIANTVEHMITDVDQMNCMNRWALDEGVYKKPEKIGVQYRYAYYVNKDVNKSDGELEEGQGLFTYVQGDYFGFNGGKPANTIGIYEIVSLNFQYRESISRMLLTDRRHKKWKDLVKEKQKLYTVMIERQMKAIKPEIELTEKGTLAKNGDKEDIEAYLYVKHTGELQAWNSLKSIYSSSYKANDGMVYETEDLTYEEPLMIPDQEEGYDVDEKFDFANQSIEVHVDDPDQVEILDLPEVDGKKNTYLATTDEDGKVTIKVEQLKPEINTDLHAEWKYELTYKDKYEEKLDATAKLHLGSGTWIIYGMMSYGEYHLRDTTGEWFEEVHNDAGFDIIYGFEVGPFVADGDWMDDGTGNMCLVRTACSIYPLGEPYIEKGYCYHTDLDVEEDNKDYYYDFANWGTNSYSSDDMAYVFLKETKTGIKALFQFVYQDWWKNVLFWYEDRNGSKYAYPALSRIMFPLVEGRYPIEYDENFIDTHFEECRDDVALHAAGEGHLGTLFVCKDSNNPEDLQKAKARLREAHMAKLAKYRKAHAKQPNRK